MMTAVEGYYNGTQIVIDEDVQLRKGQRVIVTLLDIPDERKKKKIDLRQYIGRGQYKFPGGADAYVKELRENDRA